MKNPAWAKWWEASAGRCLARVLALAVVAGLVAAAGIASTRAQEPSAQPLGCFVENPDADPLGVGGRDLDGAAFRDAAMTAKRCQSLCADQGFDFAGVQDGAWCFCGNGFGRFGQDGATCDVPCAGDPSQMCGGKSANLVFGLSGSKPTTAAPAEAAVPGGEVADTRELARQIQTALKNLDCYTLRVDGIWGRGSRGAMERFNAMAGTGLETGAPTPEAAEVLAEWSGGKCETPQRSSRTTTTRSSTAQSSSSSTTTRKARQKQPVYSGTPQQKPKSGGSLKVFVAPGGIGVGF